MNKKGFTLIELLGSIIILTALALVAFPAVLSLLNSGQEELDSKVIKFVKSAAEECVNDNIDDYGSCLNNPNDLKCKKCTTFEGLKDNGYISTTFYDKYKNDVTETIQIKKNSRNSRYCYGYGDDQQFNNCRAN